MFFEGRLRFARQNRGGPPSEFPLTSTCTSIVHHLSGLYMIAQTPPRIEILQTGQCCSERFFDSAHITFQPTNADLYINFALGFRKAL